MKAEKLQQATVIPLKKVTDRVKEPARPLWRKLAITTLDEVRFIAFDDIAYCKSTNNYTTVFLRDGRSYLCCKTLKDIEAKLPGDAFLRIHHSYLVNLQSITALKRQTSELELDDKIWLPVSRTGAVLLKQLGSTT
ncbi:MAG: LytTR family DNA-binding domain-containing protein [Bacteroidota bacterium]